jgi:hypothetical protein
MAHCVSTMPMSAASGADRAFPSLEQRAAAGGPDKRRQHEPTSVYRGKEGPASAADAAFSSSTRSMSHPSQVHASAGQCRRISSIEVPPSGWSRERCANNLSGGVERDALHSKENNHVAHHRLIRGKGRTPQRQLTTRALPRVGCTVAELPVRQVRRPQLASREGEKCLHEGYSFAAELELGATCAVEAQRLRSSRWD